MGDCCNNDELMSHKLSITIAWQWQWQSMRSICRHNLHTISILNHMIALLGDTIISYFERYAVVVCWVTDCFICLETFFFHLTFRNHSELNWLKGNWKNVQMRCYFIRAPSSTRICVPFPHYVLVWGTSTLNQDTIRCLQLPLGCAGNGVTGRSHFDTTQRLLESLRLGHWLTKFEIDIVKDIVILTFAH